MNFRLLGLIVLLLLASLGVAASKSYAAAKTAAPWPKTLTDDLFVPVDSKDADRLLEDWRWKVGPDVKIFRATVFGDLFLQTANGKIFWLDAGSGRYVEVAPSAEQWAESAKLHGEEWFHWKTLQQLRSLGAKLTEGKVFSWRKQPMIGGVETADNVDFVPLYVQLSYSGQLAKFVHDLPPGTKLDEVEFAPRDEAAEDPAALFNVVINSEEQYSIWPVGQPIPAGWKSVGKSGTKKECLEYIKAVWTDMRPQSLRKKKGGQ